MRVCLLLAVTVVSMLMLAGIGEAKKKREPIADVVNAGETAEDRGHRRGNRQHGKGRRDRGHQNEEQIGGDEMVAFDDITGDETPDASPTGETDQVEPPETPDTDPQAESPPSRRGKKGHKGGKGGGSKPDKAARQAAKEERMQSRHEKHAQKETRKEGRVARKEARKQAKRGEKQDENAESKQARKEARRMERQNVTSDCSEHSDCPTGSCCQQRGPVQKCRAFNKAEGSMCFDSCVCAEGLECFVPEGKRSKKHDGIVKGRCRSVAVDDPTDMPTNQEPAQDNE